MASFGQTFNTADLPEDSGYTSIPAGEYQACIEKAEVKNPSPEKMGLSIQFKITGPSQAGRMVFDYINLRNPSTQCEEIGRQSLGGLLRACGLANASDSDQIIGKNITITVSKDKDDSQYANDDGFSNRVKRYKALAGGSVGGGTPATQTGSKPPWG